MGSRRFCAAVDIGAGSGRVVLGEFSADGIGLEEIRRFPNPLLREKGRLRWDVEALYRETLAGLEAAEAAAASRGGRLEGCGVDAWGVDFALLDGEDRLVELPRSYRNMTAEPYAAEFRDRVGAKKLYDRTGIQFQHYNTLFQLYEISRSEPDLLRRAESLLFIPDYLCFRLSGVKANEYTIASTSQMLDVETRRWATDLCSEAGIPRKLLQRLSHPGEALGPAGGGKCMVIATAEHDTGSAVAGIPFDRPGNVYICSGTWCLMGVERDSPELSEAAMSRNFTNEGGQGSSIRFLKNLMGLWMIRGLRESFAQGSAKPSFPEIAAAAEAAPPFAVFLDCNDPSFFNPRDMRSAIDLYCGRTSQKRPEGLGGYARAVYEGLGFAFRRTLDELREFGAAPRAVHIVGGGALDELFCSCAASAMGVLVVAGPVEATSAGNLALQAVGLGILGDIGEARRAIGASFERREFPPKDEGRWAAAYEDFLATCTREGA